MVTKIGSYHFVPLHLQPPEQRDAVRSGAFAADVCQARSWVFVPKCQCPCASGLLPVVVVLRRARDLGEILDFTLTWSLGWEPGRAAGWSPEPYLQEPETSRGSLLPPSIFPLNLFPNLPKPWLQLTFIL